MAYNVTIVPPTSAGMSAEYLQTFINNTVGGGTLIQILETGPRPVLVWSTP